MPPKLKSTMRYFKAIAIEEKPFIQWALWAKDAEELEKYEPSERALIVPENEIPDFQFGVCPYEIVEGTLIFRENMSVYEREFENENMLRNKRSLYNDLKDLHFEIQFADAIKEDSTGLKTDFDTKLLEYNALKNNGYGNNF